MPTFSDVFGGSTVQPSDVGYRAVALAASVTLSWPAQAQDSNYVARIMDVTPSGSGLTITMPDARYASNGADVVFFNPGASTYTVLTNTGSTICTVPAGQAQYVYLKSNATQAGTWGYVQFASLASAVTAASLVGPGIAASGSALYNSLVVSVKSVDYTIVADDRTKVFAWTGGLGTLTLPSAATAGSDFFCAVTNRGTGVLTIARAGSDLVDGATSLALTIGESCFIHCSGAAFYSVGRGRSTQFNFTLLSKAVTSGTYTLSVPEAQNQIQKYTGALTGNVDVVLPATVQVYYVTNQTTNIAYTLRFKTAGVGTTVTIANGQNAVLFCDGLNVVNSNTGTLSITTLVTSPGTAPAPALTFSSDTTSGFFQPAVGAVGVTISGAEVGRFTAAGWSGSSSGSAASLSPGRTINGVLFDGTTNITVPAAAGTLTGSTLAAGVTGSSLTSVGTLGSLNVTGAVTAGSFSGNASSATKLATARTINGVSFDGTANITVSSAGDFTGSNQSLTANGYQKLPGGLVLQWGSVSVGDITGGTPGSTGTVNFPTSFATGCLQVIAGLKAGNTTSNGSVSVTSQTTTTFDYQLQEWDAAVQDMTVTYIAIGY